MSIYKHFTVRELQASELKTFDVYMSVYGLRYHVKTIVSSEKEATKNALYRLGYALFPGKSPAFQLLEIRSNNPVIHFVKPNDWDIQTIKEVL